MTSTRCDLDLRQPFTYAEAIAAGVSPAALRGRAYRTVFRGVYLHASVPDHPLMRIRAALLIHPPLAFASHVSAARVYGIAVPNDPDEHVSVLDAKDRRRRAGIQTHVAPRGSYVTTYHGVRVSAPGQTFVELARDLDLVELVVAGDDMVRRLGITPDELRRFCAASTHRHAASARRAAAYVREGVDSPMETRLRMLLVLAGLPEPEVNFKIFWENGRVRYRFDLSYPSLKLIVEYDGRQHREDLDQWDVDTERKDWFDHNGWMLVPVFSRGIFRRPDETLARVVSALRSRGCRDLPTVLADDWRRYFPVRR